MADKNNPGIPISVTKSANIFPVTEEPTPQISTVSFVTAPSTRWGTGVEAASAERRRDEKTAATASIPTKGKTTPQFSASMKK